MYVPIFFKHPTSISPLSKSYAQVNSFVELGLIKLKLKDNFLAINKKSEPICTTTDHLSNFFAEVHEVFVVLRRVFDGGVIRFKGTFDSRMWECATVVRQECLGRVTSSKGLKCKKERKLNKYNL